MKENDLYVSDKKSVSTGPAQGEGLGGGAGSPHFLQKDNNKII